MSGMNRRELLASMSVAASGAVLAATPVRGQSKQPATVAPPAVLPVPEHVVWHDVKDWGVEGRAFEDTERFFDRLPARAKGVVRDPVWRLSHETAGMSAHFETDATAIYLKVELEYAALAAPHMLASGKSGLDLYTLTEKSWRWVATYRPEHVLYAGPLVTGLKPGRRKYQLNLPLYNGVKSLHVGIIRDEFIKPIAPRKTKPILFYGTSVTQGACASRAGMAFLSIIGRRMERPILNFGFSGNGVYELEVGRFLNEIDAAIFVLDCVGNSKVQQVAQRVEPLVRLLRDNHPQTPILMLERPGFADGGLIDQGAAVAEPKNLELRKAYGRLLAAGITGLHYQDSHDFLGDDGEGTVDGSHATDLGMMRYADAVERELRKILP